MSSTQISKVKAMEYINHYRQGLPPGAMRSAWVGRGFIDAIIDLANTMELDGVRIYLARYTEDDAQQRFAEGEDTMIIVPTEAGDDVDSYHDYMRICPPHCDADSGD